MNEQQIDGLTYRAVQAALAVLDAEIPEGKRSEGALGDALAEKLHKVIAAAITNHIGA